MVLAISAAKPILSLSRTSTKPTVTKRSQTVTPVTAKINDQMVQENRNMHHMQLSAGVCNGYLAMMCAPLMAQADVTPSLQNLLYSVLAGGVVLGAIATAVSTVSTFDRVNRS